MVIEPFIKVLGNDMKKKILFVVDERMMGGVSVVLNDLVHLLDKSQFDIDILALNNHGEMLADLPDGVSLIFGTSYFSAIDYTIKEVLKERRLSLFMAKLRVVLDLKTGHIRSQIKRERRKCLKKHYDVEVAFKDGFTALFTAYGNTPKKIHWLHCSYQSFNPNEKYENLFHDAFLHFQKIIGVTPRVVNEFNQIYHLETISEAIPIAMDTKRILTCSLKPSTIKLDDAKIQIAVIGRFHPVKGYDRMVNVFARLKKDGLLKNVEIHMLGEGPIFQNVRNHILDCHLEDKIILEGRVQNPYAELKNFDFLLLPSYSEAFGTVISEAFILGVPVLSTHTSASELSIIQNKNGWSCENSEAGIYQSLKELILKPEAISECKKNLQSYQYKNQDILKKITEILRM